jgi:pyruvate formate lyase activating enzyme
MEVSSMEEKSRLQQVSLEAKNPFELRVDLGRHVPESDVRAALASGEMGFLHSFTTGSAVDGPGMRVVAWLTGCQFRCLYCHNPDTWNMMNGVPVALERAKIQLAKYRHGLKIMKGGLTVSGGEPLMQHRFVLKLLAAAHTMGIHTALDTNGYLGGRLTDGDLEKADLVLLDIKAWGGERHTRLTGMELEPVLDFARRLAARKRPVWLRYVLVPGWTDDPEEIARLAGFVAGLGNVERVDVLPLHQMGAFKWKQLGIAYKLQDIEPPSKEIIERACTAFREAGLKVF